MEGQFVLSVHQRSPQSAERISVSVYDTLKVSIAASGIPN